MKYQHVFFDLDHTLWDFEKNSELTLNRLYTEFKLWEYDIDNFLDFHNCYAINNNELWKEFLDGLISHEDFQWKRMWLTLMDYYVDDIAMAYQLNNRFQAILPTQRALIPFAKDMLDYCQDRYTLHLLTNGTHEVQSLKLQNSGILPYFTEIITADKCNAFKPMGQIFDYALKVTKATAEGSLMIGDSLTIDIIGAKNAGWDQVLYNPLKKVHAENPTFEIHNLIELKTIL
ncbi:YjjG family noncanonical pyrimidine nucleotidase [Pedobacter sp. L105]|uniref:YjjG family noncanonical pyrimidine nucleotidase n=1 Tax=Pedobacter sp. L105 TaxID=1641871 RepID=UPI00131E73AE|nr:YjjG family noncanonical pyrimidine nucleotidase [Pedobacter sp. L105]